MKPDTTEVATTFAQSVATMWTPDDLTVLGGIHQEPNEPTWFLLGTHDGRVLKVTVENLK